jgi:hypothetical protein
MHILEKEGAVIAPGDDDLRFREMSHAIAFNGLIGIEAAID